MVDPRSEILKNRSTAFFGAADAGAVARGEVVDMGGSMADG
jgi:hypothetical protein